MKPSIKNKLVFRIFLSFSLTTLLFATIVGGIFFCIYSHKTIDSYREDFVRQTEAIAGTLAPYFEANFSLEDANLGEKLQSQLKHANLGLGFYLRFVDDLALSNIWIVDQATQTIHVEFGKYNITYSSIPAEVRHTIDQAMQGTTAISERWVQRYISKNFVIASPIKFSDGTTFATVVVHARSKAMSQDILQACYVLLTSLLLALLTSLLPAYLFTNLFVMPLKKMARATNMLTLGHYTVHTGVTQKDEIGSLARNIDILADRLATSAKEHLELEEMRKNYLSNISHELRTPVAVIRCSVEALCDGIITDPETVQLYYQEIHTETLHLDRIIGDLLELSRLQSPNFHMQKEKINFISVVEDAIKTCTPLAQKNGLRITYTTNAPLFILYGDFGRLRQMLVTVLDNGIKFSAQDKPIAVSVTVTDTCCLTTITNTGEGIQSTHLPHIFDPYYTLIADCNPTGTGLGLAIAKQIANRHNIEIDVKSVLGEETSFSFYFSNGYS